MTEALVDALRALDDIRTGYVIRDLEGQPMTDGVMDSTIERIYRRAGLPERGWHILRHSFGTHAALFGVNPWKLMQWMGHKRIDETMLYVHFASDHQRPLPQEILHSATGEADPDRRIVRMLGSRTRLTGRGKDVAKRGEVVA